MMTTQTSLPERKYCDLKRNEQTIHLLLIFILILPG